VGRKRRDESAPTPRVTAVGAAAVDEWYAVSNIPEPDGGAFAHDVTAAPGGVGANVAVALDRLDRDVGLVSRVGDDEYGRQATTWLADTGVNTDRVVVGDEPTTRSLVLRDPTGERAIVTTGESFRSLQLDDATLERILESEVIFVTAYAPDRVARRLLDAVVSRPAADCPAVVFDLSGPVTELVGRGTAAETIHAYVHHADLFIAGGVAAPAYFGSDAAAVKRLKQVRTAEVGPAVLTHGAEGMTAIMDGGVRRYDAFDVDVVDTTGAGDAFIAGLIDRWLLAGGPSDTSDSIDDAVQFAAAVAAINCTERSTQAGLPTREAVQRFLAERGCGVDE